MFKLATYSGFKNLPAGYDALFEQAASECVFLSLPWFINLSETVLGPDDKVYVYGLEQEGDQKLPVAALVMLQAGGLQEGVLRTNHLSGFSNCYSPIFSPAMAQWARAESVIARLVYAVCHDDPRWDSISLQPLDYDANMFLHFIEAFKRERYVVQSYLCFGNWFLRVENRSFAEYFEGLPSALKNTIKRKRKKLSSAGNLQVEVITGAKEGDWEKGVEAYQKVYGTSWKVPEPFPSFIPGLIRMGAHMGWLRLGVVYLNGEPIASQLWTVHGGVASIFKLAYDERFAHLSAGSVLTATLMEHVIDVDKVREVDYLTGDDSYKRDWMSHRRERWGILALNPRTIPGILGVVRHVGGRSIKKALGRLAGYRKIAEGEASKRYYETAGSLWII